MGYAGFQGHLIWLIISRLSFPSFFFFFFWKDNVPISHVQMNSPLSIKQAI